MHDTRIRLTGTALLFALLVAGARSDEKELAPPPRPVEKAPPVELKPLIGGREPDEVRAELEQLAREWVVRKGAVEVAHQRFAAQAEELKTARQRRLALKEPEPKTVPPVRRSRDVETAIKAAEGLATDRAARVQHLEAVAAAATELLKRGTEFDRALRAADAQRERLEAALGPALAQGFPADQVPTPLARAGLGADAARARALAGDVAAASAAAKTDLADSEPELIIARAVATAARDKFKELTDGRAAALAGFEFEDQLKGMDAPRLIEELVRLRKALNEKLAALKGDEDDYKKAEPLAAEARAQRAAVKEPPVPTETKPAAALPPLDEAARQLDAARQYLGARVRTADERAEKTTALSAALDEVENKAERYARAIDDAQLTAARLGSVAAALDERVGRGALDPAKVPPDGDPGAGPALRARLDTDGAAVQSARAQRKAERDALRKTDPVAGTVNALTATVLGHVNERIALLSELKSRAAEYAAPRGARSESEQKRIDQRAAERIVKEAGRWDPLLALDRSQPAADLTALIAAYYKELIELDEKAENIRHQREALAALIASTNKEAADIAKLREVQWAHATHADGPEPPAPDTGADTGDPGAFTDKLRWDRWLADRLVPTGLKAESGLYHDELARLAVTGGANARRVYALTGNPPPEPWKPGTPHPEQTKQPAAGGEIAKARAELLDAHVRGLTITGSKIGAVLLLALIFPALVMRVLRRAIRGGTDDAGNPSPVLSALRRVLKLVVWAAAGAVVLSILGFDVTALVVALAIGGLALALAARPMIADVLGSLAVFADRRFKVGDVVRLGSEEPARVVGLTWRSTALRNNNGLVVSVPNRQMTEASIENLSRGAETYDALAVTISTDKDAGRVISVIRAAIAQCKNLSQDHGVTVVSFTQRGIVKVVQYRFWWFLKEYEARNKTRDEVFARIAVGLSHEDMNGIELTLA